LKRLGTAMGRYWKKLAWIWVWRHSSLGLAPRPLGIDGDHADSQRDKSRDLGAYIVSYWPKGRSAIDADAIADQCFRTGREAPNIFLGQGVRASLEKARNGQGNPRKTVPFSWMVFARAWPGLAKFG
jgi:hypothetical protein